MSCVCGYSYDKKGGSLARHKKTCKEYLIHSKTMELQSQLDQKTEIMTILHNADMSSLTNKIQALEAQLKSKDDQLNQKDKQLVENYKQLTEKDKQLVEKDKQIKKLENALIQKPSYNVNNIHNGDVNNIVMVNAWGNETFDHITEEDKVRALRNYMTAIPNIVEQIHFGEEKKNRNLKFTNKRAREVVVYKETADGVKPVHEDLNEVLEELIASGKYVLDPVAERLNMTKYKKFREDLRESERIKGKLYAEQKSAVKRKLMDNATI